MGFRVQQVSGSGGAGVQSVVAGTNISVDNTDPQNPIVSSTADDIIVVANYSALPAPGTVTGQFYWCSAFEGTKFIGVLWGGTYRPAGLYYSNGVSGEYMDTPSQATQAEVNTGTITNKWVSPDTLTNATVVTNKQPVNSNLTAISALVTDSFGLNLLTKNSGGSIRTYIGAGVGNGDALTTNPLSQFASTTSLQLKGVMSDETGAGSLVFGTSPTFTTDITTPLIIGGTAAGSKIDYKNTTGVGTTSAVAHEFWGGNNGATNLFGAYNDGQFLIGTTTRLPGALGRFVVGQGTSYISIGELSAGVGAIWINEATPSTTNYVLRTSSTSTTLSGGNVNIAINGSTKIAITSTAQSFTPTAGSSGSVTPFSFTSPASTNQTASTEINGVLYTLATNRQWATGALTTQREVLISAPTYRFVGASTISDAATLAISGAPIASTNATITRSYALWSQGLTRLDAGVYNEGSGLKHQRVTTGSISAGATSLITVTWATAFADSSYTVQASVVDSTTSSLSLSVVHIESVAAGSVTVRILNNAIGSLTGTLHVTAIHD